MAPRSLAYACAFLAARPALAYAQFKVTGPAPYTAVVARQNIKALLDNVDSSHRKQTVATLTGWLPCGTGPSSTMKLIAAYGEKPGRASLPDVVRPLVDARVATAVIDFSWREQRDAAFLPDYAPMFEDMLIRVPDSAKPMQDDLVRAPPPTGQLRWSFQTKEQRHFAAFFLDMRSIGMWRKTAMQVLPFYRDMAQLLLAVDVRGFPGDKRDRAEFWLYDPRSTIRENAPSTPSSSFSVRGRTAPAPAATPAPARTAAAAAPAAPVPPAAPAPVATYNGPKSATMHCVGNPIAQNAEYVFEGSAGGETPRGVRL